MINKITLILILISLAFKSNAQTAGQLDATFNNNSGSFIIDFANNDNLTNISIQPDQKVLATGVALSAGFMGQLKAIRLNADGTPDLTFATNSVFTYASSDETYGYSILTTPDNKILIGGIVISISSGYADILLLQLDSSGNPDPSFGVNGVMVHELTPQDDLLQGMDIQPDGKIVISGTLSTTVGFDIYNTPMLMRLNSNGSVDSTFGVNGIKEFTAVGIDNELTSCLVQDDGKIVASGHYQKAFTGATDFDVYVVRTDSNGVADAGFGNNGEKVIEINLGIDDVFGMDVDSVGNIYVGGFTTAPISLGLDMLLMKLQSNGNIDSTFGVNGVVVYDSLDYDVADDLKIQNDGKILLCGSIGGAFLDPKDFAIWRYNSDGTPDLSFNNGVVTTNVNPASVHEYNSLAIQSNGKIVAGGKFLGTTNNDIAIHRYYASSVSQITEAGISTDKLYPNPSSGKFNINSSKYTGTSLITIYNTSGGKVFESEVSFPGNEFELNQPSGVYFYQINNNAGKTSGKLIIVK